MASTDTGNNSSLKKEIDLLKNIISDMENEISFLLDKIQLDGLPKHDDIIAKLQNELINERYRIQEKDNELNKTNERLKETEEILYNIKNSEDIIIMTKDYYERLSVDLNSLSKIKQGIEETKEYIYSLKEEIKLLQIKRDEDIIKTKTEYDEIICDLEYRLGIEEKRSSMAEDELSKFRDENRKLEGMFKQLNDENCLLEKTCEGLKRKLKDLCTAQNLYEDNLIMNTNVKNTQETGDAYNK